MPDDFTIDNTRDDTITVSDPAGDSIINNVYLSLTIAVGSWWFNPAFGHRLGEIKKLIPGTEDLVDQYIRMALDWLLVAGRITAIATDIDVDRDHNRITFNVTVTRADGQDVTITDFVIVI